MKRTPLKRIGKIGKRNIDANKIIKQRFQEEGIEHCELKLEGCMDWPLQIVHRHKRVYYRDKPELLYAREETALGCQSCHDKIEDDRELTEEIFKRIR
jgi:hypothetical protein